MYICKHCQKELTQEPELFTGHHLGLCAKSAQEIKPSPKMTRHEWRLVLWPEPGFWDHSSTGSIDPDGKHFV